MQWLTTFFGWLFNPLGSYPPEQRRRIIFWTLHILLVVLIVVALGVLNYYTGLERVLRTRVLGLNRVWLPLLFLLGYALYWLIRWLYWLLGPDGPAGEFDDIEQAWAAARAELERAGLSLTKVPLYLVLGKPASPIDRVFASSHLPFQVRHAPARPDAPLHVHATREAIFVTCEAASLLPVQTDRLLEAAAPSTSPEPASLTELFDPASTGGGETPLLGGSPSDANPMGTATAIESAVITQPPAVLLLGEQEPTPEEQTRPRRASLLKEADVVDLQTRRLRHVCRMLFRDRQPYCPVNGILVLLPLVATASPEDAGETAGVVRHDLEVARTAMQLDCPRLMVVCDSEQLPGFPAVAYYFPEGQERGARYWVLGQHFPLVLDVPHNEVGGVIESGLGWVADTQLPLVIARLWQREGEEGVTDRSLVVELNIQLFDFLHACRERLLRLGRLAGRAVESDNAPALLGGCYLAGTGADGTHGQAFLAGVLRRALELQNNVRWTTEAVSDDAAYHRYTFIGYVLLLTFVAVVLGLLWTWW